MLILLMKKLQTKAFQGHNQGSRGGGGVSIFELLDDRAFLNEDAVESD